LFSRARQGDQEAFAQLYEAHFDKIFRYVVLEDPEPGGGRGYGLKQVFVKAYESIGSYQSQGVPFTAWLFRIAHNQNGGLCEKTKQKIDGAAG